MVWTMHFKSMSRAEVECDEVHINMSWVPKKGCQCKINNSPSFKVSRCLQEEEEEGFSFQNFKISFAPAS
jgi:hypothetical protein